MQKDCVSKMKLIGGDMIGNKVKLTCEYDCAYVRNKKLEDKEKFWNKLKDYLISGQSKCQEKANHNFLLYT